MPSFEIEFEVFCATCGDGLCNQSDGRNSRSRHMPQVTVEVCQKCLGKATDPLIEERDELQNQLEDLEKERDELQGTVSELEAEIESLRQSNWQRLSDAEKDQAIRMY